MLTTDPQARKAQPVARGVLDYFPDAIAAVAHVSFVGNQQHNPGQPMHWAREKSKDHADCIARHLIERGYIDSDNLRHTAKLAWRALALLQLELEEDPKTQKLVDKPESVVYNNEPTPEFTGLQPTTYVFPETGDSLEDSTRKIVRAGVRRSMMEAGCRPDIAKSISDSFTFPKNSIAADHVVYLSGPMRSIEKFNFPLFDRQRDFLVDEKGWIVVSPADIDRHSGEANPSLDTPQENYVYRDFHSIFVLRPSGERVTDGLAMLPGWEKSRGAMAEFFLALWLNMPIFNAVTGEYLDYSQVDGGALLCNVCAALGQQSDTFFKKF